MLITIGATKAHEVTWGWWSLIDCCTSTPFISPCL